MFIRRAGTIILACMVIVWALLYFPNTDASGNKYEERVEAVEKKVEELEGKVKEKKDAGEEVPEELEKSLSDAEGEKSAIAGEWKRRSVLGRVGLAMEPIFRPLGWDWKIGMAALASFPAREVIVGTFGLIYDVGDVDAKLVGNDTDEKATGLKKTLRKEWAADPVRGRYGVAVAVSVMVFYALCCQCASTLAVIRRETKSCAWPAFTFAYMTALAYVAALVTFQLGALITDMT
jgi:ferrous iron transport protein B